MSGNSNSGCNVYIGNLNEKVSETRNLINQQASPLLDMNPKRSPIMPLSFFPALSLSTIEPSDLLYLSGQDKNAQNSSMTTTPLSSRKSRSDPVPVPVNGMEISHHSMRISGPRHYSSEEPPPPGVTLETNGYVTHLNVTNYDYSRRVFGATLDSISRSRSGCYNSSNRHY